MKQALSVRLTAATLCMIIGLASIAGAVPIPNYWNGTGSTDNWTDTANWSLGIEPVVTNNVVFINDGNGRTQINMSGVAAPVQRVNYYSGAAEFTLGFPGQMLLISGGDGAQQVDVSAGVSNNQMINADISYSAGGQLNNWAPGYTLTINGDVNVASWWNMHVAEGAFLEVNGSNNTSTGTSISRGGAVTAGSLPHDKPLYLTQGILNLNGNVTNNTIYLGSEAEGDTDAYLNIGQDNELTLNSSIYIRADDDTANRAFITGGDLILNGWRSFFVTNNVMVPENVPELTISNNIRTTDGNKGFSKYYKGTIRLDGVNNAPAGKELAWMYLREGRVQITADHNLGRSPVALGDGPATCTLEYLGPRGTIDNQIRVGLNNYGAGGAGILANGSGPLTISANNSLWGGAEGGRILTLGGTNTEANTYGGIIADNSITSAVFVVKSGSGKWVLAAANTYSGTTTVEAGVLEVTGSLASDLMVNQGATVGGEGETSGSLTIGSGSGAGTVAVDGSSVDALGTTGSLNSQNGVNVLVEKAGANPVRVVNYGTWTGAIGDFTLDGSSAPLGARGGGGAFSDGGDGIDLNMGYEGRTWTGTASTHWDINTSLNWAEGDQKYLDGDEVAFGNAGAGLVELQASVGPLGVRFTNTTGNNIVLTNNTVSPVNSLSVEGAGDVSVYSTIAGAGELMKDGDGVLMLPVANTFTGGTTLSGGTTLVHNSSAFGTGAVTMEDESAALYPTIMLADGMDITNDFIITDTGNEKRFALEPGTGGYARISGDITSFETGTDWMLRFSPNEKAPWAGAQVLEVSGDITAKSLIMFTDASGVLYLSGSNTFSGNVWMRNWGNRLRVGNDNALNGSTVLFSEYGWLQLVDGVTTPSSVPLTVDDTGVLPKTFEIMDGDGGAREEATFGGSIAINETSSGTFRLSAQAGDWLTLGGSISGTGTAGIVKQGGGHVVLAGENTYSLYKTEIEAGTLWFDGEGAGAVTEIYVETGAAFGGAGSWGGDVFCSNGSDVVWGLMDNSAQSGFDVLGDVEFGGSHDVMLSFDRTGSAVNWTNEIWATKQTWNLLDVAGSLTGAGGLSLVTENWTDSEGQSLQSVRNKGKFLLQTLPQEVNLLYIAPPAPGMVFVVR